MNLGIPQYGLLKKMWAGGGIIECSATLSSRLLVIRFMADLLQKYRGSVVIMVGRGGAEPHYVHN